MLWTIPSTFRTPHGDEDQTLSWIPVEGRSPRKAPGQRASMGAKTPPFHSLVLQSLVADPELKRGVTPRSKKAIGSLHS